MPKQNLSVIAEQTLKQYQKKDKRQRAKMRVSGSSVKRLQKIIKSKS